MRFARVTGRSLGLLLGLLLTLGLALVPPAPAQAVSTRSRQQFIAKLAPLAQQAERRYGIPSSVLIAQAIAGSDWGRSKAAIKAKNYFNTGCIQKMSEAEFGELARAQIGKPYQLGAEASISNPDPKKFDCSELVQWLFGRAGHPITDLAAWQYDATRKVDGDPKVGDLVFLRNNPARSNGIGHVAIITAPLSDGDWEIVEARSKAEGVVLTTLSYWTARKRFAGIRRYPSLHLSNAKNASAAGRFKSGCIKVGARRVAKFSSASRSFLAQAAALKQDTGYATARASLPDTATFVSELAKVAAPDHARGYARRLMSLIAKYRLADYDVVPISLTLESGDHGYQVKATQQLLRAAGQSTPTTGDFGTETETATKRFQKAQRLEVTGKADPKTLEALTTRTIKLGSRGDRVRAVTTLLSGLGYPADGGRFDDSTRSAVRAFQEAAGRVASGIVDRNTWAALLMGIESSQPEAVGVAEVGSKLRAKAGDWGPGKVKLSYQWYREDRPIKGADAQRYTPTESDLNHELSVQISGTRRGHTSILRKSLATEAVQLGQFSKAPQPTIAGKAKVGSKLKATVHRWAPVAAIQYQWLRDGEPIDGASGASYRATKADQGAEVSVQVSGSRDGFKSQTITSVGVTVSST